MNCVSLAEMTFVGVYVHEGPESPSENNRFGGTVSQKDSKVMAMPFGFIFKLKLFLHFSFSFIVLGTNIWKGKIKLRDKPDHRKVVFFFLTLIH